MTPAEIIAMAREAGLLPDNSHPAPETRAMRQRTNAVQRFAALVAAKEREACAQVCEAIRTNPPKGEPDDVERGFNAAIRRSAYAIRARDRNQATGVVTGGVQ